MMVHVADIAEKNVWKANREQMDCKRQIQDI